MSPRRFCQILLIIQSLLLNSAAGTMTSSYLSPEAFHTPTDVGVVLEEIISETLSQPILYDKVIPLIFQYEIPSWNISEFRLEDYSSQCSDPGDTSTSNPFSYNGQGTTMKNGCRILYRLRKMFDKLIPIQLDDIRPLSKTFSGIPISVDEMSASHKPFEKENVCRKIQMHFNTQVISSSDLQLYLDWITQECLAVTGENSHIFKPSNSFNVTFAETINQIHFQLYSTYYETFVKHNYFGAYGYMLTSKIAMQSLQLVNFYEERSRWINAQQDCKLSNIPSTLVSHQELKEGLAQIASNTSSVLSIPKEEYRDYYALPLTECVRTKDIFLVRVLVPVLSEEIKDKLKLMTVAPVPFLYDGQMCKINISKRVYLYNEESGMAYPTICKPNKICQVSDDMIYSKVDKCSSYLISRKVNFNAKADVEEFCDVSCEEQNYTDAETIPEIVQVRKNQFAVSGNISQIQIECRSGGDVKSQVVHINPSKFGSKWVTIPCGCKLGKPWLYGSPPCKSNEKSALDFTVYPAIPIMFLNESTSHFWNGDTAWKLHSDEETTRFFNLNDIIDVDKFQAFVELSKSKKKSWQQTFLASYNKKILELELEIAKNSNESRILEQKLKFLQSNSVEKKEFFTFIFIVGALMAVAIALMMWMGIRQVRDLSLRLSMATSTKIVYNVERHQDSGDLS